MSTSASYAHLEPTWKQEVNRRIAAHKTRKGAPAVEQSPRVEAHAASRRAAEAAARVAARYANAPSYSEMLASEARAALRAAEAASRAALEAQAAAASVLAGIEAAAPAPMTVAEPQPFVVPAPEPAVETAFEPEPAPLLPAPAVAVAAEPCAPPQPFVQPSAQPLEVRWERELPVRSAEPALSFSSPAPASYEPIPDPWANEAAAEPESLQVVEAAQPIHANLIEFPRELVAARKARPRRAEGALAEPEQGAQLSIFEVDPSSIEIEPAPVDVPYEAAEPAWSAPEWSSIELEPEPEPQERAYESPMLAMAPETAVDQASMNLRMMAVVVDTALVLAAVLAAAVLAAHKTAILPGLRTIEIGGAVAFLAAAAGYYALFLTLGRATPGMKYAHIRLCTLDGQIPSRAQRTQRLAALALSLLPIGLGVAWSIFDEQHLTWHDRLSGTYLRRY